MTPSSDRAFCALQNSFVCAAALLVPADQRPEWRREWQAELWHVRTHSAKPAGARGRLSAKSTPFALVLSRMRSVCAENFARPLRRRHASMALQCNACFALVLYLRSS